MPTSINDPHLDKTALVCAIDPAGSSSPSIVRMLGMLLDAGADGGIVRSMNGHSDDCDKGGSQRTPPALNNGLHRRLVGVLLANIMFRLAASDV